MDCSLHEASRIEPCIAPEIAFFGPIGTTKRGSIPCIRVLSVFQKRLYFLQAKEWFFRYFSMPCILGTFCRFVPCNLSRLPVVLGLLTLVDRYARLKCCVCGVLGLWVCFHRCARLARCGCSVLGLLALVHQCTGLVCCACGVLGLLALVQVCPILVCCVCSLLGLLAYVHRCSHLVCRVACAQSWAS